MYNNCKVNFKVFMFSQNESLILILKIYDGFHPEGIGKE